MSTDIKINYINKSFHRENPTVVVFTKPINSSSAAQTPVWQVMKNIGYNSWHKFIYPSATLVQVSWYQSDRLKTLSKHVEMGKNYSFEELEEDFTLVESSSSNEPNLFEIINNAISLEEISVVAYKDENPIQFKDKIGINQKVVFALLQQLCFKISSKYDLGDVVSPEFIDEEVSEISMEGLHRFDVILQGDAENGYTFKRKNKVIALRG